MVLSLHLSLHSSLHCIFFAKRKVHFSALFVSYLSAFWVVFEHPFWGSFWGSILLPSTICLFACVYVRSYAYMRTYMRPYECVFIYGHKKSGLSSAKCLFSCVLWHFERLCTHFIDPRISRFQMRLFEHRPEGRFFVAAGVYSAASWMCVCGVFLW